MSSSISAKLPPADGGLPLNGPWWRNPWVWLVLAGPLVVIFAGLITVWIAARGADTLVDEDYYRKGIEINKTLAAQPESMTPAVRARNHAADPSGAQKSR